MKVKTGRASDARMRRMSTSLPQLGTITEVDVRGVWPHEAHVFTPWLFENADRLGEALGLDLDLTASEHAVGSFSLDLIGTDVSTGRRVIIENQIEGSDHGHLGQLMTYAGGTEPNIVVWITTSLRPEHRAALDWLNSVTDEATGFFGVEVSAVVIGDSLPAPLFRVVAKPNDWGKHVKATTTAGTSAKGERYRQFWGQFYERVAVERTGWTNAKTPPSASWITLPAKSSLAHFGVSFAQGGKLRSELYLGSPDPERNRANFDQLYAVQAQIEPTFGRPLSWEPLESKVACRIADYGVGTIDDDWSTMMDWFIDSQDRFRASIQAVGGINAFVN
jgi:hypothetical protein